MAFSFDSVRTFAQGGQNYDSSNPPFKYVNNTNKTQLILEVYLYMASGKGTYLTNTGQYQTGNGNPMEVYFNCNGVESNHVTVAATTQSVDNAVDLSTLTTRYTLTFNGLAIGPGQTAYFYLTCLKNMSYDQIWTYNGENITGKVVDQTHTVNYNANGGTGAPSPQTKYYGSILTLSSQVPTRTGYRFIHWANNSIDTQATQWYDPGGLYGYDEDITLYAIWEGEKHTYTFNPNGGTGGPTSATKQRGVDFTFPSSIPTFSHHIFQGWKCEAASGGPYQANETVHDLPDEDLTWYAQWVVEVAGTVSYDANGGEMAPDPQTKYWDIDLTLSTDIPVRYQYVFTGWGRTSDATIVEFSPGDTYRDNQSIILYAIWTPGISATIHFDPNGGTGEPGDLNKLWNVDLQLSSVVPRKSLTITYDANGGTVSPTSATINQEFLSWNTEQNGSGTSYAPGANYTIDESVTLYAQWGTATVTNMPTPTINGSSTGFVGWFTSETGGTQISNGSTISDDTTVYAHWELLIHYVTEFQGVDIGIRIEDQYKTPDVDITISELIPEVEGYEFLGWSTTENATTAEYTPGSTYSKNEPATLYPVFVRNTSCTVTFDLRGGVSTGGGALSQSVQYGQSATPPSNPTKTGKRFVGWLGDYTNVTSDRTIYALWDASPLWIFTGTQWVPFAS